MSKLTHENDFLHALRRIDILCRGKQQSDGVLIGRIMEIAQSAIASAEAADQTITDIQNGHVALQHS